MCNDVVIIKRKKTVRLTICLDERSKLCLKKAAALRRMSVSDFVRTTAVPQAKREIEGARENTIVLTPEEQLAYWNALNETPVLTESQRRLSAIMRGET